MALGLLGVRGTLREVRVSSDANLTLRLVREFREDMNEFRAEMGEELRKVNERLTNVEHTLGGMAAHLFAVTHTVKDHERRVRKLETRPPK